MKEKEKLLVGIMLEKASTVFGRFGCNDVPDSIYNGWTIEERQEFVKEYHEWNGDPEEIDKDDLCLPDFAIMAFLAYKMK